MLTLSTVTPAALVAQSLDAVRAELGPVAAVPGDALHRMAEGEIRGERERRAPAAPPVDLRVVEYIDFFKLRNAPYVLEERVGESGRSYTVKVYLPEAYTAAYMIPSDETGRLVRWGVKLNDGRIVSRDGIFRLRFPAAWERIKAKAARARGEARDKLLGEALWGLLTPDEQRAMIASVNVRDFADGRGEKQALADLEDFLQREGSLLAYADHEWWRDISADYSTRLLGGPVGSPAWLGATFAEFTPYKQERAGRPREDLSPETMPVTQSAGKGYIIHPAITDPEYWTPPGKDHPRRAADKAQVFPILRRRFGSVLARVAQDRAARLHNNELPADLPSEYTVEGRLARQAMYAEILRTIDPAWAKGLGPSDRMLEPLINAATRVFMGTPPALWSAPEAPARAPEPPPLAAPMQAGLDIEAMPGLSTGRRETLRQARALGASDKVLAEIADESRMARKAEISLPGRYGNASRATGWARLGKANTPGVSWGEKEKDNLGHTVFTVDKPGKWEVMSSDGFNREERAKWKVTAYTVGDQVWFGASKL